MFLTAVQPVDPIKQGQAQAFDEIERLLSAEKAEKVDEVFTHHERNTFK